MSFLKAKFFGNKMHDDVIHEMYLIVSNFHVASANTHVELRLVFSKTAPASRMVGRQVQYNAEASLAAMEELPASSASALMTAAHTY